MRLVTRKVAAVGVRTTTGVETVGLGTASVGGVIRTTRLGGGLTGFGLEPLRLQTRAVGVRLALGSGSLGALGVQLGVPALVAQPAGLLAVAEHLLALLRRLGLLASVARDQRQGDHDG